LVLPIIAERDGKNFAACFASKGKRTNASSGGQEQPTQKNGALLRGIMPWMKKRQITGTQAAYR
jgi:hypothetical protein